MGRTAKGLSPALAAGAGVVQHAPHFSRRTWREAAPLSPHPCPRGLGLGCVQVSPQGSQAGISRPTGLSTKTPPPLLVPAPVLTSPPPSGCPPILPLSGSLRTRLRTRAGEHDCPAGQGAWKTCWDMTGPGRAGLGWAGQPRGDRRVFLVSVSMGGGRWPAGGGER